MNRRHFIKSAGTLALGGQAARPQNGPAAHMAGAIFRADMAQCRPGDAMSRNFVKDRWRLIDYETEEGVKGIMASILPEHRGAELTLPLNAAGPHRIYLGINYTKARYPEWPGYGQLDVKLSGDAGFCRVAAEAGSVTADGKPKLGVNNDIYKSIHETYWKTADLSGRSLVFRQPREPYNRSGHANISNLCYVKLAPLDDEEQRRWKAAQRRDETRRGAILFCTAELTGATRGTETFHPTSHDWCRDEFEPYANSDFGIFVFEAMRGNFCLYRTKIGDVGTQDNRWPAAWVDPLASFTRLAHENGMKIFASLRMIGPQYPMNREPIGWARHYWKHREWAKLDRDGVPLSNWSLAFPGVRAYWLSLLRECLDYGIDGIQLHLNRSTPLIYYEAPVVQAFRQKHGEDPRRLPETDSRWRAHCAAYVTGYLREVRKLLDEKPGRELGVTIYGEPHKYDREPNYHPIRYNCDVETWMREGLVDYLMPSPRIDLALLRKWREVAGHRVHLWPDLMPRAQPADAYVRLAKKYYDAGADGYCLWDAEQRPARISEWAAVQQLGHTEVLDRLNQEAAGYYRRVPIKYLAGFSVRESFHDG